MKRHLSFTAALTALAGILVVAMFHLAASGRPLHHEFADRAAAVDGEMVDVVGNMPLVWSFCGIGRILRGVGFI
jgi:ATP-binding cassette, subfamily B, bacterial